VFRLNRVYKRNGIYLTIEGDLKAEFVHAIESACHESLTDGAAVTVIVKNVTEIDSDGFAFLRRLVMTKAQVRAIGIYSRYILRNIKTGGVASHTKFRDEFRHDS
jgi:ABC-type transporter Mla MlaB component